MSLPAETLSFIFLLASSRSDDPVPFCNVSGEKEDLLDGILPSRSFVSLNLVCRWARQIALSSPHCWKGIPVLFNFDQIITPRSMIEDRLNRSKHVPFNLSFYTSQLDDSHSDEDESTPGSDELGVSQLFNLLTPHIHRCQQIAFLTPQGCDSDNVYNIIRMLRGLSWSYPTLQKLSIVDERDLNPGIEPSTLDLSHFWPDPTASNVTSVRLMFTLEAEYVPRSTFSIAPPGVTRLSLEYGFDSNDVIDFLRHTFQLEHLSWDPRTKEVVAESDTEPDDNAQPSLSLPLLLPKLLSFRLCPSGPKSIHFGSWRLVAPECKELHFYDYGTQDWDQDDIAAAARYRSYWDALTLPQLRLLSIFRSPWEFPMAKRNPRAKTTNSVPEDDPIWLGVEAFLDRHRGIEELIIPSLSQSGFPWHWFFCYLVGRQWNEQTSSFFSSSTDGGDDVNDEHPEHSIKHDQSPPPTIPHPLPHLRVLWFEIDPSEWQSDKVEGVIVSIRMVLLARPDVRLNLCVNCTDAYHQRSREERYRLEFNKCLQCGQSDYQRDDEERPRSVPLELEGLAREFDPDVGGVGKQGGLKLLPFSAMPWYE
ncbi:hypothetical protein DL93DRAFT_2167444 [Clavulina sp. PMI_390]|nr:hypothetical protein DL93DRAFT_2167444 [Clavulina sp. PMI_390]